MKLKITTLSILGFLMAGTAFATPMHQRENPESKLLLTCQMDGSVALRFFYNPPGEYFHFPLIFRAVEQTDPRLNTTPVTSEGRTAYISLAEMRSLIERLAHSGLTWQESEKIQTLGTYKQIPVLDSLEILIICSKGTARTTLLPTKICKTLAPLDTALKTPRALWEFQLFRQGYGCTVEGFHSEAYPDR